MRELEELANKNTVHEKKKENEQTENTAYLENVQITMDRIEKSYEPEANLINIFHEKNKHGKLSKDENNQIENTANANKKFDEYTRKYVDVQKTISRDDTHTHNISPQRAQLPVWKIPVCHHSIGQ